MLNANCFFFNEISSLNRFGMILAERERERERERLRDRFPAGIFIHTIDIPRFFTRICIGVLTMGHAHCYSFSQKAAVLLWAMV